MPGCWRRRLALLDREMARLGKEARAEISIPHLPAHPNHVRQHTHPVTRVETAYKNRERICLSVSPSNLKVFTPVRARTEGTYP